MAEYCGEKSNQGGSFEFNGRVIRPGDPVVVYKLYGLDTRQEGQFADIAARPARFTGNHPATGQDGQPAFGGVDVPHFEVLVTIDGEEVVLGVRGFECDWTTPDQYENALDVAVSKFEIPNDAAKI
ncbi:MAG: hypothetical protein AAB834_02715 [Patescibacteria group bacterium]